MCLDKRCTKGVTACMGPNGCNGWGAVSPRGGKYRQRRTDPLPAWAVAHHECKGTGRVKCGCRRTLTREQKATLAGRPWRDDEQRWSSLRGELIAPPKRRTRKPRLAPVESVTPAA